MTIFLMVTYWSLSRVWSWWWSECWRGLLCAAPSGEVVPAGSSRLSSVGGWRETAQSVAASRSRAQLSRWLRTGNNTTLTSPWPQHHIWSSPNTRRPWASRTPTTSPTTWRRTRKVRQLSLAEIEHSSLSLSPADADSPISGLKPGKI